MKTLYLDCGMGAAGDMLSAALLELLSKEEQAAFLDEMNAAGIPGVVYKPEPMVKGGILGTHMTVTVHGVTEEELLEQHEHHHDHEDHEHGDHAHDDHHEPHHHHSGLHEIAHMVSGLNLSSKVKEDVMAVYQQIAEAESHAHGMPAEEVHFHEVGTADAVADVSFVSALIEKIHPDEIVASPVATGFGHVHTAHGILPVPAPATAYILQGVPSYSGRVEGELCTPTGAALLKHFAGRFGQRPVMTVEKIGYGMGCKDFEQANCLRAMLGNREETGERNGSSEEGTVPEISFNVDDMTAEEISFAMDRLFEAGAVEVYTIPIGMKKSRPGTLIRVIFRPERRTAILETIFRYTSTIGVRETSTHRYTLERREETVETEFGPVRRKISTGYGARVEKWEYDDIARIAAEKGMSPRKVREQLDENKGN